METMVKLIRSKGVGLYFCTQNPDDVPEAILAQLGLKVQHALRAFTAKDRKSIKLAAENFPITEDYKVEDLLTQMGIGEALVSALNEKGIPTPLAHTVLRAPRSRMDVLDPSEIDALVGASKLVPKYNKELDRESAYEMLNDKICEAEEAERQAELKAQEAKIKKEQEEIEARHQQRSSRQEKSTIERVADSSVGRTVVRELTRGILGVLGLGGRSRSSGSSRSRSKKPGWW
jgi:uncharacterized protein